LGEGTDGQGTASRGELERDVGFDTCAQAALAKHMVAEACRAVAAEFGGQYTICDVGAAIEDFAEADVGALVGLQNREEAFEFSSMGRVDDGRQRGAAAGWSCSCGCPSGGWHTRGP
jgi:hypothetical protein